MKTNVLVVHGGGPTAVMNASLYGVIKEAKRHPEIGAVYAALGGMEGILEERLVNLSELTKAEAKLLLTTPGSAIGSSRYPITKEVYRKIEPVQLTEKRDPQQAFFTHGYGRRKNNI